ncbi:plasmid mobilization relaxosome protein MobC [Actinacidiphila acididurans]|uniref:Bacterial mobilisation domain-containing protein n=1 Tax=Actinacidiphila acididurans TaxID=2784346 RepID=A0ABS2U2D3_9ACTN|nr:plasmid mobilization relaxosome protein MobC [Actinacidiphila acididurans]MBM9509212.1 hypothetical protein [Actinacidiphila acididurans]
MTADDPAATHPVPSHEPSTAPGGASCRVRRSYGPTYALPRPEPGGKGPAGPRAGAHGDRPDVLSQGAPDKGNDELPDPPTPRTPPFPHRKPRRRARNPTERAHKLTTRLSDAEYAEIAGAARRHAVTVARFLATAGLTAARGQAGISADQQLDAAIDELAALRTAVSRVGNNVNQMAHIYNAGGIPLPGELDHALRALLAVLARVDAAANALVQRRH